MRAPFAAETVKCLLDAERQLAYEGLDRPWTVQGLGMLRMYLSDDKSLRLHVWDPRIREGYENEPSETHTHPWNFTSHVLSGHVIDLLYIDKAGTSHCKQKLRCGVGGGLVGHPVSCELELVKALEVSAGRHYHRRAEEIHVSRPKPGTVTLLDREFGSDVDHAYVYWDFGQGWVSAEPRPATPEEVHGALDLALENWDA